MTPTREAQCATCGATTTDPADLAGQGTWAAGEDGLYFCPLCLADHESHLPIGWTGDLATDASAIARAHGLPAPDPEAVAAAERDLARLTVSAPNSLFREQAPTAASAPADAEGIRRYRVTLRVPVDLAFDTDSADLALALSSDRFKRIVAENLADWLHLGDLVSPDQAAEALTPFIDRIDPVEE